MLVLGQVWAGDASCGKPLRAFPALIMEGGSLEAKWHAMTVSDVLKALNTSWDGLTDEEAARRLQEFGLNEIKREKKRSAIVMFLRQFKSVLIGLLLAATALSLFLGEVLDAIVILAIVFACAVLGFVEEYRSERALELLKEMAAPTATVIRSGTEKEIPARELVPGDVVVLRIGDKVPADLRLIEAVNLRTNEAPLTGESVPVDKHVDPLPEDTPLPERSNMAFSGTSVVYGRGKGVVVATGMNTELGKIAAMVQEVEEEATPLEKRMAQVGKWLGALCLAVCIGVSLLGILQGYDVIEMVMWGISLAVAAVPEALPAVVTGALAIGMREMAKRNAIVRRLAAVETLGSTQVICSDKTGTMTKGEMTVRRIYHSGRMIEVTGVGYEPRGKFYLLGSREEIRPLEDRGLELMLRAAALCNDASLVCSGGRYAIRGDTTEGALLVVAAKAGLSLEELREAYPRIGEVPFTSERKRMSTVHLTPDGKVHVYMKGAPEVVLRFCDFIWDGNGPREIRDEDRATILKVDEEMAGQALRNLAIAFKELDSLPEECDERLEEGGFVFLGIMGMIDPPREEVKHAIELCRSAGVRPIMITGDHKQTAMAVARELGMDADKALTGVELDQLSDEELKGLVDEVDIYARTSPSHKVRILEALKSRGYVVAMTGDGVNDAPALKKADIGVAMGITGTDVAKEAADMVLADDNFATIVAAVEEGRRIVDNIKKYIAYLMRCNIAEILVMVVLFLMNLSLKLPPLTPAQILWVNLTTDGLPALALGVDPAEPDVMRRPPRDPRESLFSLDMKLYLMLMPVIITASLTFVFLCFLPMGEVVARSVFFLAMICIELACALNSRSLTKPIWAVGAFKNRFLWISVAICLAMSIPLFYVPLLAEAFNLAPVGLDGWLWALGLSASIFVSVELVKWAWYRAKKK